MGAALVKKCFVGDNGLAPLAPTAYPYPYYNHRQLVAQQQQQYHQHHNQTPTNPSPAPLSMCRSAHHRPPPPMIGKAMACSFAQTPQPRALVPLHPPLPPAMPVSMSVSAPLPPLQPRAIDVPSKFGLSIKPPMPTPMSPSQCHGSPTVDTPRSTASTSRCESVLSDDSFYAADDACSASYSSLPRTPLSTRRPNPHVDFTALLPSLYVIDGVLGTGTTATCYRCHRRSDGRAFACKVVNKRHLAIDKHQREELARQLHREVDVMKHLRHPNIAQLEEVFENETFMIILMELLEGGELFDYVVDQGRLQEADAMQIARDVLSAVTYMHAQGIVHRDLKPENLLLTKTKSGRTTVKLIDFGFSRCLGPRGTASSFLGTGGYLAPEILLHHRYNTSVDMWSFGVILYLMLSGRLPFASATQLRPGQSISSLYRLTFPRKYWSGVSEEAKQLVQRLLVLSPHRRLTASHATMHPWFSAPNVYY